MREVLSASQPFGEHGEQGEVVDNPLRRRQNLFPDLAFKFVGAFEGLQDLRFERLQDKVEAYRIGESVWACARGKWAGWKDFSVVRKPEFVPSAQGRSIRLNFTVNATVVMQLDQDGAIIAAEVTDRSRLVIVEEQA